MVSCRTGGETSRERTHQWLRAAGGAENLVAVKNNKKSSLNPLGALDDLKSYRRAGQKCQRLSQKPKRSLTVASAQRGDIVSGLVLQLSSGARYPRC